MIDIKDKRNCCGCSACASICPKQCISMVSDNEGFLYPILDESKCIDCGACEQVCIQLKPFHKIEPMITLAAINKNINLRLKSASGGIFYALAEKVINEGGVVFGARFDDNWQVIIDYAEIIKDIEKFMGSKYVQARIETAYIDAKRFLVQGKKVLFSGTPCQIAGLHKYLKKQYSNLLSVDFICHGTPSPKVWRMYLTNVINIISLTKTIQSSNNLRHLNYSIEYDKNTKTTSILSHIYNNHYMRAFLSDLILRPSCHVCKIKSCSSGSDITLADFWGIWNVCPEMYDDKGTSMLFINTEKGKQALPSNDEVKYIYANYEDAKKYNKACIASASPHHKREKFFNQLQETNDVIKLIEKTLAPSYIKQLIKALKKQLKKINKNVPPIEEKINKSIIYHTQPIITSIEFRNKKSGWKDYQMKITIKDLNK